jgi:UDP-glucose 4-epimerase
MKILVTGGAGYIGSHAVDALIKKGDQVFIFDNFSTGHRDLVNPKAKLIEGDVRDVELVHSILNQNKIEGVIHFAAFTNVAESIQKPDLYYGNNFQGTVQILKAVEKTAVRYFVFSSTAAVYQDPGQELVTEDSTTNPVTPYGRSKLMSEQVIRDCAASLNYRYMILRYFNVAGASEEGKWGQRGDEGSVLIKRAALAAAGKIKSLSIFGTDYPTVDGTGVRDFIHVDDLADVHLLALHHLEKGGESDLLNCGYGHGFSVLQVIETMKKVSGQEFEVRLENRRPGDLPQVVASNDKVKSLLKWTPKRDNLELICRTAYEWEIKSLRSAR